MIWKAQDGQQRAIIVADTFEEAWHAFVKDSRNPYSDEEELTVYPIGKELSNIPNQIHFLKD